MRRVRKQRANGGRPFALYYPASPLRFALRKDSTGRASGTQESCDKRALGPSTFVCAGIAQKLSSIALLKFENQQSAIHNQQLQISPPILFQFERLEQGFEIPFAERFASSAANDLKKQGRAILQRLGKDLKQIAFVVAVDQDS